MENTLIPVLGAMLSVSGLLFCRIVHNRQRTQQQRIARGLQDFVAMQNDPETYNVYRRDR